MSTENQSSGQSWAGVLGAKEFLTEDGNVPISQATEDDPEVVLASDSTVDGDTQKEESVEQLSKDPEVAAQKAGDSKKAESTPKAPLDKESITVTDANGQKRKVEIDYSNKDSIKRAFAAASGMRKFQAERDQAFQARKATEEELGKLRNDWSSFEEAYQKGPEALHDTVYGQGSFNALIKAQVERTKFMERASPEEIEALKEREASAHTSRELDKIRKENSKFKEEVTKEREEAQTRALESRVHPAFEKYRFNGKLGNADDEQMFDEMLWNSTLNRLKPYEEKGLDLSPTLIEQEFRKVATAVRSRISAQADKKASQVVAQKKQEATENVQAQVKSGYSSDSNEVALKKAIQSGNTGDIFKNWNSFRGILGGSKK